jgi:hypothetical protein
LCRISLSKALSYQNLEARRDEAIGRGVTVQLAVLVVVPEENCKSCLSGRRYLGTPQGV